MAYNGTIGKLSPSLGFVLCDGAGIVIFSYEISSLASRNFFFAFTCIDIVCVPEDSSAFSLSNKYSTEGDLLLILLIALFTLARITIGSFKSTASRKTS